MAERNLNTPTPDDRDLTQRSLGFVGLSAIVHIGLLVLIVLSPSFKTLQGDTNGTQAGTPLELKGDAQEQIIAGGGLNAYPAQDQPSEVLLADSTDASAVTIAQPEQPLAEVAAIPLPVEEPVTPSEAVKPVAPAKLKASKPLVAKVAKQVPAKAAIVEGDVAIQSALSEARKMPQEEEPAKLDAPEMDPTETEQPTVSAAIAATDETTSESKAETDDVASDEKALEAQAEAPTEKAVAQTSTTAPTQSVSEAGGVKNSDAATAATQSPATTLGQPSSGAAGTNSGAPIGAGTATMSQGTQSGTSASASQGSGSVVSIPAGAAIRDSRTLVAMPGNPRPTYPLQDKVAGRQGTATLIGSVRADGTMSTVALERSSGSRFMDESAAKAFKQWRFKPGQAGLIRHQVQFQLVGDAKELPTLLRRQ